MNDIKTAPIDAEAILATAEHFVCCHDSTKTFCGLITDTPLEGWADEVDCAACMVIHALEENTPIGEKTFCPVTGYCTHEAGECDCPYDDEEE